MDTGLVRHETPAWGFLTVHQQQYEWALPFEAKLFCIGHRNTDDVVYDFDQPVAVRVGEKVPPHPSRVYPTSNV